MYASMSLCIHVFYVCLYQAIYVDDYEYVNT